MKRQLLIYSDKFNQALKRFGLDQEKIENNIIETVKHKEGKFEVNKKTFFHTKYKENKVQYIIPGYVLKKEKAFLIEVADIWDKDPSEGIQIIKVEK